MKSAVNLANENGGFLVRFPGGFWRGKTAGGGSTAKWFGTTTVQALVKRGVLRYVEYKQHTGGGGQFPITAIVVGEPF